MNLLKEISLDELLENETINISFYNAIREKEKDNNIFYITDDDDILEVLFKKAGNGELNLYYGKDYEAFFSLKRGED